MPQRFEAQRTIVRVLVRGASAIKRLEAGSGEAVQIVNCAGADSAICGSARHQTWQHVRQLASITFLPRQTLVYNGQGWLAFYEVNDHAVLGCEVGISRKHYVIHADPLSLGFTDARRLGGKRCRYISLDSLRCTRLCPGSKP